MSHLHAWMRCVYTQRHGYTHICTFPNIQTHTNTQAHEDREMETVFCPHPQTSWHQIKHSNPGLSHTLGQFVLSWTNTLTQLSPSVVLSFFERLNSSLIFRIYEQNYWQSITLEETKDWNVFTPFSAICMPSLQLPALLDRVHNMKHKQYVYFFSDSFTLNCHLRFEALSD